MYLFIGDTCQEKMLSKIPEPCISLLSNCSRCHTMKGDVTKSIYGLWSKEKWTFAMLLFSLE